ncbi:hypothetical protein AYI69_g2552 [Smittium culicis]|uniref:Uncharacterized protein n=1 Tax=Smittium culicis TaxID=133412 RepID=A0A1R1YML8_9FUNG|nr:hypothetical protein AYI69_g2552 [Smittium culicis]
MRASDIHHIDDAQTTTIDGTLKLVIVAPKEKHKGRPIIRPCEISCHSDKLLCPVEACRPTPKARAIGATIAANAGIPSDSIVAQAFCVNQHHTSDSASGVT